MNHLAAKLINVKKTEIFPKIMKKKYLESVSMCMKYIFYMFCIKKVLNFKFKTPSFSFIWLCNFRGCSSVWADWVDAVGSRLQLWVDAFLPGNSHTLVATLLSARVDQCHTLVGTVLSARVDQCHTLVATLLSARVDQCKFPLATLLSTDQSL